MKGKGRRLTGDSIWRPIAPRAGGFRGGESEIHQDPRIPHQLLVWGFAIESIGNNVTAFSLKKTKDSRFEIPNRSTVVRLHMLTKPD